MVIDCIFRDHDSCGIALALLVGVEVHFVKGGEALDGI